LPVYPHHGKAFFAILAALLVWVAVFVIFGASEIAFKRLGFTRMQVVMILVGTFIGALVNIPLWRIKSSEPLVELEEVQFFWITYRIPRISTKEVSTLVAVNLGGAVIPTLVSVYVLSTHPQVLPNALLGILLTSTVVHMAARKVPGLGIATPAFLPPLIAATSAYLFAPGMYSIVAYVSGTLGTLVGADLTNLRSIGKLGAPVASIGGAGTFDGVFLSGLIAVLL
jgi:uncharacterized membrane protein